MPYQLTLSQLLNLVQDTIDAQFYGQAFWVKCEVTDVKRYDQKNWCFCKLLEKKAGQVVAESPGVFWQQGYLHIRKFEQATGRKFESGIEISALATVKFHPKHGFKLEILEIDLSSSLGQMEMARQETIRRLLSELPGQIRQQDDQFITFNNQLPLPQIIQRVALITANHSDGQRDFIQELTHNAHGYQFRITGFYTTIQGDTAAGLMVKQLEQLQAKTHLYDVVVMVRGGGSQTDLKPFDDFELAKKIALFPLPVLTGIGHDRNTSITDLMARQYKVPTKVAAAIVDHNHAAEQDLVNLSERMEESVHAMLLEKQQSLDRWSQQMQWILPNRIALRKQRMQQWEQLLKTGSERAVQNRKATIAQWQTRLNTGTERYLRNLKNMIALQERLVVQLSPQSILKRGFAMAEQDGRIVLNAEQINIDLPLITRLAQASISSTIIKIEKDERENNF
jgi:exodeoxyribonuclease VII large subunit